VYYDDDDDFFLNTGLTAQRHIKHQ